jgi:DNA-binding transcriptional ArsR family regulator
MSAVHSPAEVFSALGDGSRLAVLSKLSRGVALSATVLAEHAPVTRQAIVKHLQILAAAGLVMHHRQGREVLYALQPRRIAEAREFLEAVSVGWDQAIGRLRELVEEDVPKPQRRARRRR